MEVGYPGHYLQMMKLIFFIISIVSSSFIKISESEEDKTVTGYLGNVLNTIFSFEFDLNNFDFHGNEIDRPDLTLEKGHLLCHKTGNNSKVFRKFAGLINESSKYFNFWRVDELKARYYKESRSVQSLGAQPLGAQPLGAHHLGAQSLVAHSLGTHSLGTHSLGAQSLGAQSLGTQSLGAHPLGSLDIPDFKQSSHKLNNNFPNVFKPESLSSVQLELAELFVADLLLTVIPSIQSTLIDYPADVSGILLLLFLKQIEDFEGYFEEFREFYDLMQRFASCAFELPAISSGTVNPKILIEELFQLAVRLDLPYTLEVFYAMELIDFGDCLLFKFVLETAHCPVVINRFFDFVDWNSLIDGIPKIHFVYENYGEYLAILFEYQATRINWRAVDDKGLTLLGKILPGLTNSVFSEGKSTRKNSSRSLLKAFLSHVTTKESSGTFLTDEKDILMECYDNETEGFRLLAEYVDCTNGIHLVIEDYLKRILRNWQINDVVNLVKVFKFLVKKTERSDSKIIIPILMEAFEFFNERLSKETIIDSDSRSTSRNSNSSSQSGSGKSGKFNRSSSGTDFFKSFLFADTVTAAAAMPKSPKSPKAKQNLEMIKFISQEVERIVEKDNLMVKEILSHWNIIIISHGHI